MASSEFPCPVCGDEFTQRIIVEWGQQWNDLYPGLPLAFFRQYPRRCTVQYDSKRDTTVAENESAMYFHDDEASHAAF